MARTQLRALGLSADAIRHLVSGGRLHPLRWGVYALGRPQVDDLGRWMAAVLSCGARTVLSHTSAAALLAIEREHPGVIEVSVPLEVTRRRPGLVVHRRSGLNRTDLTRHHGIPVTTPAATLVDLAACLPRRRLEAAVNNADKLGLVSSPALRAAVERMGRRPGVAVLRELLDRRTFRLTDSELERLFLPIARRAGLPVPETGRSLNGFRVDFHWPDLGLVVETDGLTYHRTPAQQGEDRMRDQAHTAAGLTPLRFTHEQVRHEPEQVRATLMKVARRLRARAG